MHKCRMRYNVTQHLFWKNFIENIHNLQQKLHHDTTLTYTSHYTAALLTYKYSLQTVYKRCTIHPECHATLQTSHKPLQERIVHRFSSRTRSRIMWKTMF